MGTAFSLVASSERVRAYTKDDGKKNELPETAVMKIVNNIDSTAVSAAAMKLTQVGFIDLLREIQRDKFMTLKAIKDHFRVKLDKVVMAKDYQLRCQRLVSIASCQKII